MSKAELAPTLWRTCRVLANHQRLKLLQELLRTQPQGVTQLATALHLQLPAASHHLRALEARGLLQAKRIRRRVEYRFTPPAESAQLGALLTALRTQLREKTNENRQIFDFATGFTHPARVNIIRQLKVAPRNIAQLQALLQLSRAALGRHLQKLIRRGYIKYEQRYYLVVTKLPPVASELLALA